MEIMRGKKTALIDGAALAERLRGYPRIHIDIGTGDGRYPRHLAQTCPQDFVIGVDACRENLRAAARRTPENALFVIANALSLPPELRELGARLTIYFPWGSLLAGLLDDDPALPAGLAAIARPGAALEVCLNEGALDAAGYGLAEGAARVRDRLRAGGFAMRPPEPLPACELKSYPTTWAKRLAFGRAPRAMRLCGARQGREIRKVSHGGRRSVWRPPRKIL